MSEGGALATTTALLAQAVYAQGRLSEAGELCRRADEIAAPEDAMTQAIWRGVQAKILAREGRCEEAEALAREAVALVEPTDLLSHRGDAMLDLADVLRTCDRTDESDRAARAGLALYELKGNVGRGRPGAVAARRSTRRQLNGGQAELHGRTTTAATRCAWRAGPDEGDELADIVDIRVVLVQGERIAGGPRRGG